MGKKGNKTRNQRRAIALKAKARNAEAADKKKLQNPRQGWWLALKGARNEVSKGWLPDISLTIFGATLFTILTSYLSSTRSGTIILFSLGAIYLIWLLVVMLGRHFPFEFTRKGRITALKAGVSMTILVVVLAGLTIKLFPEPEPETEFEGKIIPAEDTSPPTHCVAKIPNPIAIYHGSSVTYVNQFPCKIATIAGVPLLTVSKTDDGLSLNAQLYGEDDQVIADVVDNKFTINRNNFFKRERPDRSTFILYDKYRNMVLNVRYLNSSAIRVSGIFRTKGCPPIIITNNKTIVSGSELMNTCHNNPNGVVSTGCAVR